MIRSVSQLFGLAESGSRKKAFSSIAEDVDNNIDIEPSCCNRIGKYLYLFTY